MDQCIIDDIDRERARQDAHWGEQNHDPFAWLVILMEEIGEASKGALESFYGGKSFTEYRKEMVEVASVAIAALECMERGKWTWPKRGQDRTVVEFMIKDLLP